MPLTTALITLSLTTLIAFPFHLWALLGSSQDPAPTHSDQRPEESEQVETIEAIEMAVAEAKFRRWGEEQRWSECRMGSERREFRERWLGWTLVD